MSQHDMDVADGNGATVLADLNAALVALAGNSSGATAPATTFPYQLWADTTTGLLKIRNAANSAWITIGTLASANLGLAPQGAITASGLTQATGKLIGRTTASTGAPEEISIGTGLSMASGTLSATQVPASANTTIAASDAGKCLEVSGTVTIPNSVMAAGDVVSIFNNSASSITLTASITTLYLAGTATTGNRTLAQRGLATIRFISATAAVISGAGLS